MAKARYLNSKETYIAIVCVGCDEEHQIKVADGGWQFNRDLENPTISPSLLVRSGHYMPNHQPSDPCWCNTPDAPFGCKVCHSFIKEGNIQYLNDCTHAYAGKTIPLPQIMLN